MSGDLVQPAPPDIDERDAARIAREVWAVEGSARTLGSHQDRNFLIAPSRSGAPLLLKIANPSVSAAELEAQSAAALAIAHGSRARVPLARRSPDGTTAQRVEVAGTAMYARLLDFLEGDTLSGSGYLAPAVLAALGALAAAVDDALAGLEAPGALREHQWDLRHAPAALAELLPHTADPGLRAHLAQSAQDAWSTVAELMDELPVQFIHGDLTDDNVLAPHGGTRVPDAVIDLGDLNRTWAVGELAITVSSVLHHDGVDLVAAMRVVTGYHGIRPLAEAEIRALWPLVVMRGAVLVASAHHVLATDPGNAYAAENLAHERRIFEQAASVPLAVATALVRESLGEEPDDLTLPPHGRLLAGTAPADIAVIDLSATSPLLHEGRWGDVGVEAQLATQALAAGAGIVMTRFGEPRLTLSGPPGAEPENVVLGVELTAREPVELVAPWPGRLRATTEGVELVGQAGQRLRVCRTPEDRSDHGVPGPSRVDAAPDRRSSADARERTVAPSEPIAAVSGRVRVTVDDGTDLPAAVTASMARAWRAVAADPTPLVVGEPIPDTRPDPLALLVRREAHFAAVQEYYYRDPPVIVRGWREHLIDADGRVYLDTLNNVSSVGHAHPRLVRTVADQWSMINTNSRFHHPAVVELSERLAALLPDPLDTVFLVNSGSEAVDLSLRLAQAWSGRRDVLAIRESYHGWTFLSDAVSTSTADNPTALETRPEWVHTLPAPNPFRGPHRGADADRYAQEAVAEVDRLVRAGAPLGGFIAESLFGNGGGIALPDGYLDAVYAAVRAGGGLAIADEVQVGYGRLGEWFWGFQQQGVVPDVVAVAKAMGNGHPLGAVVTTAEIAQRYRSSGYFFSSAGGSTVSCAVGLAVLDVIRDERLQQNARDVGAYLKTRLQALGARHPLLGAVHGSGFYLGPEFVRDRETWEPATDETAAICDRLRELGVIAQPTGDHQNILKVKPPMCFTRESADVLVAALDRVLTAGW